MVSLSVPWTVLGTGHSLCGEGASKDGGTLGLLDPWSGSLGRLPRRFGSEGLSPGLSTHSQPGVLMSPSSRPTPGSRVCVGRQKGEAPGPRLWAGARVPAPLPIHIGSSCAGVGAGSGGGLCLKRDQHQWNLVPMASQGPQSSAAHLSPQPLTKRPPSCP